MLKKTIFELIAAELLKVAAVPESLEGLSDSGDPAHPGRPGSSHGMRHFRCASLQDRPHSYRKPTQGLRQVGLSIAVCHVVP